MPLSAQTANLSALGVVLVNLEEMLGLDLSDPEHRHADTLVTSDAAMLDALVALRERFGVSQTQIAARMGVSPSAVSRIESGDRDPRLSTLRRYAMAVGAVVHHDVRPFEVDSVVTAALSVGESDDFTEKWHAQGRNLASLMQLVSSVDGD